MEDLLVDREQCIAVDLGTKPTATSQEDWDKLERRARSTIRLCLSDSVLLNVSGEDSAVKEFVSIKIPCEQVVSTKEVVSPQNG